MKNLLRITIVVATLIVSLARVDATLIDNGTYTTDQGTSLDWLDMSFTDGLSYNQTLAEITSGGLIGWRFATSAEFDGLIDSAVGGPYTAHGYEAAIFSEMKTLTDVLLGQTYGGSTFGFAVGYVDSGSSTIAHARQFGYFGNEGFVRPDSGTFWDKTKDFSSTSQGSFLVRGSAVPDNGTTVTLFGLALLGLFGARRMMQKAAVA